MVASIIRSCCLFSLVSLGVTAATALAPRGNITDGDWNGIPGRKDNPWKVPDFNPPEFEPEYIQNFCPANTTSVEFGPVIIYFPFRSRTLFNLIGDFDNLNWTGIVNVTSIGPDNTANKSFRIDHDDPNASKEELVNYFKGDIKPYGFYHQQVVNTLVPKVLTQPGLQLVTGRAPIVLRPGCDNKAVQFGWYFNYCFAEDVQTSPPGFNLTAAIAARVVNVTTQTVQTVSTLLTQLEDAHPKHKKPTKLNDTRGCASL